MSWTGDWMCSSCEHVNFKKRDSCQRCGSSSRYSNVQPAEMPSCGYNKTELLAGDWYCQAANCGGHNYASRTTCYRCGAVKLDYAIGYEGNIISGGLCSDALLPGWKSGDWICARPGCGVHNYASRTECFKCTTPRNFGRML